MFFDYINQYNKIFGVNTSETIERIEQYLEILPKLQPISDSYLHFQVEKTENTVILLLPESYEYKLKFYLVNEFSDKCETNFVVHANKNKILNCKSGKDMIFDPVMTLTSDHPNMRYIFSEYDNNTDYIIHNLFFQPIYIEKTENDCLIKVKKYSQNFAFFGAENPFLFNSIYSYFKRILNYKEGININNYTKLPQIHFRINSNIFPFFEFYNFYLSQLDIKINIYIKQLYGGSDLYECNGDDYDIKNLDFLASPISNVKCKNKTSLFNRLFKLEGTKILAGYITPNSYFDIYAEIDDNTSEVINLFPLEIKNSFNSNNTAKYLKKGVEYKINFELDHLIKLDPDFDAEIKISNVIVDETINPQKPTYRFQGEGFTIKSNNDAMIYFIKKLSSDLKQLEIDINSFKEKTMEIGYLKRESSDNITIDLGFEGYGPSNILKMEKNYFYMDNIYEKLKHKLVKDEKLYIYYPSNNIIHTSYNGPNLNNKNNDFNIFLIPNNGQINYLIVCSEDKIYDKIKFDLCFCKKDTTTILHLSFKGWHEETNLIIRNDNYTENVREHITKNRYDYQLIFQTNQPLVFTYSYYDLLDENINKVNNNYIKEREELSNLTIEEIVPKNEKEIKIKFKPNYKQSSTRYIILIAQKSSENTIEKFKDACFVTGLLTQRPNGVKVEAIYDGGIEDSINAEVDISDILSEKNNKYLMSIISQELRYSKKIHFYTPKEFSFGPEKPDEDDSLKGVSLALAIVLPIVGAIIIAIVIIFLVRHKCHKQEDPENDDALSKLTDKSYEL